MITIIDYKSGNLRSISNSFKKIGVEAIITSDPNEIANAKHLVLPGVGAFGTAMENIDPFKDVIFEHIDDGKPFLGILKYFNYRFCVALKISSSILQIVLGKYF